MFDDIVSGYSLPQRFYVEEPCFAEDKKRMLERMWHLAGHVSQLQEPGAYFLFRVAGEELIILRDRDSQVRGFFNVCRHRGSRLCRSDTGRQSTISCPYHGWTYGLDGALRGAPLMSEDFDKKAHALHHCQVRVLGGIIFVALADEPDSFDEVAAKLETYLELHGLSDAKIAIRKTYPTDANWKLVVENFVECYHCNTAHPEYCSVHSREKLLAMGAGESSGPKTAIDAFLPELEAWRKTAQDAGHPVASLDFPNGGGVMRAPIGNGALTESRDGQPVAPLMGAFEAYDGGTTSIAFNYLGYAIASSDHAVLFRFTPISVLYTEVEAIWLVRADAVEGRDYDPEKIAWVWTVTLDQDAVITEDNQSGIKSARYLPGPYSEQEQINKEFVDWYRTRLEK